MRFVCQGFDRNRRCLALGVTLASPPTECAACRTEGRVVDGRRMQPVRLPSPCRWMEATGRLLRDDDRRCKVKIVRCRAPAGVVDGGPAETTSRNCTPERCRCYEPEDVEPEGQPHIAEPHAATAQYEGG